jgi:hypothetical protein
MPSPSQNQQHLFPSPWSQRPSQGTEKPKLPTEGSPMEEGQGTGHGSEMLAACPMNAAY